MNASELALAMLEWEQKRHELDKLETAIKVAVLGIGKTQTVGNVRASYSKGRTTYDYEAAAHDAEAQESTKLFADRDEFWLVDFESSKDKNTKQVIDWRRVVADMGIDASGYIKSQSGPIVSVKLLG